MGKKGSPPQPVAGGLAGLSEAKGGGKGSWDVLVSQRGRRKEHPINLQAWDRISWGAQSSARLPHVTCSSGSVGGREALDPECVRVCQGWPRTRHAASEASLAKPALKTCLEQVQPGAAPGGLQRPRSGKLSSQGPRGLRPAAELERPEDGARCFCLPHPSPRSGAAQPGSGRVGQHPGACHPPIPMGSWHFPKVRGEYCCAILRPHHCSCFDTEVALGPAAGLHQHMKEKGNCFLCNQETLYHFPH